MTTRRPQARPLTDDERAALMAPPAGPLVLIEDQDGPLVTMEAPDPLDEGNCPAGHPCYPLDKLRRRCSAGEYTGRRLGMLELAEIAEAVPEADEPALCSCGRGYVGHKMAHVTSYQLSDHDRRALRASQDRHRAIVALRTIAAATAPDVLAALDMDPERRAATMRTVQDISRITLLAIDDEPPARPMRDRRPWGVDDAEIGETPRSF